MASRIAFLYLLGLLVASPAIADFGTYYQLALMWPGAYCEQTNAGCCKPTTGVSPARDFYITGFTAYNSTRCSLDTFDVNKIIDIEGLNQYWSSIRCPSNNGEGNWKNAWKEDGRCSGFHLKAYFETALALRSRLNPLVRLKKAGIEPDFGLYSLKVIKKAFQKGIGAAPVIQCSKGPFDKFMLYQLYFCVNENGTFIDCPDAQTYTCSKEILFHPFKKWMLQQQQQLNRHESDALEMLGLAMDN